MAKNTLPLARSGAAAFSLAYLFFCPSILAVECPPTHSHVKRIERRTYTHLSFHNRIRNATTSCFGAGDLYNCGSLKAYLPNSHPSQINIQGLEFREECLKDYQMKQLSQEELQYFHEEGCRQTATSGCFNDTRLGGDMVCRKLTEHDSRYGLYHEQKAYKYRRELSLPDVAFLRYVYSEIISCRSNGWNFK